MWDDFESADIRDELKAALRFIVRFVDHPDEIAPADFAEMRELGISEGAIEDVIHISALFNVIARIADALEFDIPDWKSFKRGGKMMLKRGYD